MHQEYLISKAIENKKSNNTARFLISPKILRALPVPNFEIDSDVDFERIMMKRTHLSAINGDILDQMKILDAQSNKLLQFSLPSYINNPKKLQGASLRDKDIITKIKRLQKYLEDVSLEMKEYFKSEVF